MTKDEYNKMQDVLINKIMEEEGYVLPEGAVTEYKGLTAEEIYNKLKENK